MAFSENHYKTFVDSSAEAHQKTGSLSCKHCLLYIEANRCSAGLTARSNRPICYGFIPSLGEPLKFKPTCGVCSKWRKPECSFDSARDAMLPSDAPCIDYVARKKRFIASNCPRCGSRRLSVKLENIRECHTCGYVFNIGKG